MDVSSTSDYASEDMAHGLTMKEFTMKPTICQKIFPSGFKKELKSILIIFFPCVLTSLFRFLNPMISLIICGHLSKLEFDAVSLAVSIINILGVSVDLGFSTAFDTLFAQIYGCNQKKKMGAVLQKAIIIMTLLYLVLACFHMNVEPFLIWLKQDPVVSDLTAEYILIYLPGLFFDFQFLTISRYLQSQNIVYPMMIAAFIGDVFSGVSQYVAIHIYGYDLKASALLQGVACFVMFAIQLGYVLITKVYKPTWDGFKWKDALSNWKMIFVLGLPGILMIGLEEWNFEIATLISGSLNGVQLGAQSVAFQCATLSFMLTMGLSISVSIRIGQYLGSKDIDKIKTCFRTAAVIGLTTSTTSCAMILIFRTHIAALFSNDLEIQDEGAKLLFFIAFLQFLDVIAGVTSGTLKACGRQIMGASIMFLCYYVLGIPLGVVLVFVAKIEIKGMWVGLMSALLIEGVIFVYLIIRTDWEVECNKAINNTEDLSIADYGDMFKSYWSEESPLIVKSDVEGDTHWVRENLYRTSPNVRKQKYRKTRSVSENYTITACRRKSMLLFTPKSFNIKAFTSESDEPFRKIVISRIIAVSIVLAIFVASIIIRVYVPKSSYFPCSNRNNQTNNEWIKEMNVLCNSTIYHISRTN